jgi:uncharacterized protein (DUF302 family)
MEYYMYHHTKSSPLSFDQTIAKITESLKQQGFGIITEIDVKATLKQKLNLDFRNYRILGACNPSFSHNALLTDDKMGLFMPCNVIVQEHENGQVEVSVPIMARMTDFLQDPTIRLFTQEIDSRLKQALDAIGN